MAEDAFRSQLLYHKNFIDMHPDSSPEESKAAAWDFRERTAERIEATAALMPPEQGKAFKEMFAEEYLLLEDELERDWKALCQRLGVDIRPPAPRPVHHRQGLGELAVRTAVRATVWELILSVFRR